MIANVHFYAYKLKKIYFYQINSMNGMKENMLVCKTINKYKQKHSI